MPVLIIDETLIDHFATERPFLSRSDLRVAPCSTREQMLELCMRDRADLVVTDFEMPGMALSDFCRDVRRVDGGPSIVVVSEDRQENLEECLACGANALVLKPVVHREIIETVARMLGMRLRRHTRVMLSADVNGMDGESFFGSARNISMSGMLVETDRSLRKGENLSLVFFLRQFKLSVPGKVIRCTRENDYFLCGIDFGDMDEETRTMIELYVTMHSPGDD